MNSIGLNCNEYKRAYDVCFQNWFKNHFLKGETDDSMCRDQFQKYNECVRKAMKDQQIDIKLLDQEVTNISEENKVPEKMNLGKNIRKLTSEFFVGLTVTKSSLGKLNNIKTFQNTKSVSVDCTPSLKKSLDWSKVYDANLNYNFKKNSLFNCVFQERNLNILPTTTFPVQKKIIEPEIQKKININIPINSNINKNINLPTNIIKEMFDPLGNTVKKEAKMSLVRIKRKKMRKHQYKKRHRKMRALFLKIRQYRRAKKEAIFDAEIQTILKEGSDFSAEKYVEEKLEKLAWKPPTTRARGILAPDWVIKEEKEKNQFNFSIGKRARACAKKIKNKLS